MTWEGDNGGPPEVHPEQTAIEGDAVKPSEGEWDCAFCGDPAPHRFEFMKKVGSGMTGRGIFLEACDTHREVARRQTMPPAELKKLLKKEQEKMDFR